MVEKIITRQSKIMSISFYRVDCLGFAYRPKWMWEFLFLLENLEDFCLGEPRNNLLRRSISPIFNQILQLISLVMPNFDSFWKTCHILPAFLVRNEWSAAVCGDRRL
jgi:hypothetical protein